VLELINFVKYFCKESSKERKEQNEHNDFLLKLEYYMRKKDGTLYEWDPMWTLYILTTTDKVLPLIMFHDTVIC